MGYGHLAVKRPHAKNIATALTNTTPGDSQIFVLSKA
jgi:hypothetical protein